MISEEEIIILVPRDAMFDIVSKLPGFLLQYNGKNLIESIASYNIAVKFGKGEELTVFVNPENDKHPQWKDEWYLLLKQEDLIIGLVSTISQWV